jgi:hypothetical protein
MIYDHLFKTNCSCVLDYTTYDVCEHNIDLCGRSWSGQESQDCSYACYYHDTTERSG